MTQRPDLSQACILNNQGVSCLVGGENIKAKAFFQKSIGIIRSIACQFNNAEVSASVQSRGHYQKDTGSAKAESVAAVTDTCNPSFCASGEIVGSLQNGFGYVYDRALLLKPPSRPLSLEQDPTTIDSLLSVSGSVVLFNLALTLHQRGRQGQESLLLRSLNMYQASFQLLVNEYKKIHQVHPEKVVHLTVLGLHSLNNQAQIQYELCDYINCHQCRTQMNHILSSRNPLGKTEDLLDEHDLEGILENVQFLDPPAAARAA